MSKLLYQGNPDNTTAVTAFTASVDTEVTKIVVCNVTGSAATYRIHHDNDGSTYDTTNALVYDKSLGANSYETLMGDEGIGSGFTISKGGTLGVRVGTGDAITFSVYGNPSGSR